VNNGVFVSALKYSSNFDHDTLVAGIARTYARRGIAVKSEPGLPGGKRADLAFAMGNSWTYVEVKTRSSGVLGGKRRASLRQDCLREILRLRAHSLKQLPRKESSIMVLATSASPTRRKAINKIAIARSFTGRIFGHDSEKVLGLMLFAPFRNPIQSGKGWKYASALIPNPSWKADGESFAKLASVQL
jgi:hypothetical protein